MKSKQLRKRAKAQKVPYRAWLREAATGAGDLAIEARRVLRVKGMR